MFKETLKKFEGNDKMAEISQEIKLKIPEEIKNTKGWEIYFNDNLEKFKNKIQKNIENLKNFYFRTENSTPYLLENDRKFFVSIDLRSANFNSLKFYHSDLVLGCDSWEQLVSKFTEIPFWSKIKIFRYNLIFINFSLIFLFGFLLFFFFQL